MRNYNVLVSCILIVIAFSPNSYAQNQSAGYLNISLNDLNAFREPGRNWHIGSGASSDFMKPASMELVKGTGVVINLPAANNNTNLVTIAEMGDLELELDFMLSKQANSGIILQGRYELQLSDSWTKQVAGFADCGGVYAKWDTSGPRDTRDEGIAPLMNVCRAPGLWQHIKIKFRAPRFSGNGEKIANAKFEDVTLNGTVVQQEVQLSGPSRFALYADEKPVGPLVLQGDGGAVAFRNISYKMINPLSAKLSNLKYRYYQSEFKNVFPDLGTLDISAQDTLSQLTWDIGKGNETFALDVTGNIQLPAEDNYTFSFLSQGMGRVYIDDELIIERNTNRWNRSYYTKQIKLSAGVHPVRIVYVKNVSGVRPALALYMQGVNTDKINLNDKASEPAQDFTDPVIVEPVGKPYLLRSFLDYGNKKLTHIISFGDPRQLNYSYDLKQGALIQIWRGKFLDVTDMWVERGEPQIATPLGSLILLSDAPALAVLEDANAAWPDSVAFDDLQNKGYTLDKNRSPTYKYILKGTAVSDKISVDEQAQSLLRELTITNAPANLYCRLASSDKIEPISDGLYAINDRSYFVRIDKRFKPAIRQTSTTKELIVPVQGTAGSMSYFITW